MNKTMNHMAEIAQHAIDYLNDNNPVGVYGCDLHNDIFNSDYYIIGNWKAEQWLTNGPGVFDAIEEIRKYEEMNFGQVSTDFSSPEKVVNMYVYIQGEEVLAQSKTLVDKWNDRLTEDDIKSIISELEEA